MRPVRNLIPGDRKAPAVGTEDGERRIFHIPFRIIANLQQHFVRFRTGPETGVPGNFPM